MKTAIFSIRALLKALILLCAVTGWAQSTNISTLFHSSEKKADQFFDERSYRNALSMYLRAAEKNPSDYHARERVAQCYVRLNNPGEAEVWLSSLVKEPDIDPQIKFEYAEVLSMNERYADALFWFKEAAKAHPNDPITREKIEFLKQIGRFIDDTLRFVVADAKYNSKEADFGASYFRDGIVFASTRDRDLFVKIRSSDAMTDDESMLNLYFAERFVTGEMGPVQSFRSSDLKTYYHDGPIIFFQADQKAAFTRTQIAEGRPVYDAVGRVNLGIYFADVANFGQLKNIVPFKFNNEGYSNAHATVSKDGNIMFFSSTMAKGYGGSDIYYSMYEDGEWKEPVNLGPSVNTALDEVFPFLANDTTLYFSSNGHGSLGGLDILVAYKRGKGDAIRFSRSFNFGSELNSSFDDFGIVTDSTGRIGYFSSNRPGGKGLDDVYFFISNYYFLAGEVRELSAQQSKLPNTKIIVRNSNGDLIDSVMSDSQGDFILFLPYDQDFLIRGEREGFETLDDLKYSTRGKTFGVDSLMLPMWKHKLFAKGRIFDNETEQVLPGATVKLYNLTENKMDEVVVNEDGEYAFLVLPNTEYKIEASKEGFIPNGFNLNTKEIFEGDLLNDIVLEEVYVEKELIFFEFDKANVSDVSRHNMNHIVRTLKKYPEAKLYIGAHADARGTHEYNQSLSNRRAEVARQYFIKSGVSPKRIEAIGFGEEFIINHCSDGVECPEEDHSKNRRAEIKVQTQETDHRVQHN